jgi:hypothetical protein
MEGASASTTAYYFQLALTVVEDCKELILSETVLTNVTEQLSLDISPLALREMIEIENALESRILVVSVTTANPELSCDIVNAVKDYASLTMVAQNILPMDVDRSFRYLRMAQEDAVLYNAKLRPWQISRFLMEVEDAYSVRQDRQGKASLFSAILLAVLALGEDGFFLIRRLRVVGHGPGLGGRLRREGDLAGGGRGRHGLGHVEGVRRPVHVPAMGKHARHGAEYKKYDARDNKALAKLFAHAPHAGLHGRGLLRRVFFLLHIHQYLLRVTVIITNIINAPPVNRKRQPWRNYDQIEN